MGWPGERGAAAGEQCSPPHEQQWARIALVCPGVVPGASLCVPCLVRPTGGGGGECRSCGPDAPGSAGRPVRRDFSPAKFSGEITDPSLNSAN